MAGVTPFWDWARRNARISNEYVTGGLAEFFGTFIVGLFAVGAGAQAFVLHDDEGYRPLWGGVLGLMFAITIFGGVSGAHVNPAVTLALAIVGKVSWIKVPVFWLAQVFGAYLGAGLAYSVYIDSIQRDSRCTGFSDPCPFAAGIFSPLPRDTVGIPFLDQVIGTAILLLVIMAALDQRNMKIPTYFYGPLFALTVLGINYAFGVQAGGVLNPARDLGPRFMALSVGYERMGIFYNENDVQYWLAPLFGPLLGGAVGAVLYVLLVGAHLQDDEDSQEVKVATHSLPPGSQYGHNAQGARPDWRNTELRKIPPAHLGPASPPSHVASYGSNIAANNNNY